MCCLCALCVILGMKCFQIYLSIYLSIGSLTWSRVPASGEVPGARDGHAACIINRKMYIFGGYEDMVCHHRLP